jgi:hypothetical protein
MREGAKQEPPDLPRGRCRTDADVVSFSRREAILSPERTNCPKGARTDTATSVAKRDNFPRPCALARFLTHVERSRVRNTPDFVALA